MNKIELLAPAGNMECLKAAINAGADAIYVGTKLFSARALSQNFTNEEIIEAIKYCHLYGVKIYATLNTLIYENEVNNFIKHVEFLYKNNIDAIIIQDIGMMDLIRKVFPKLEIHASTQMHIHNLEGVKLLEELGIKRVVLARETSIDLIKKIKENSNIDLEVFIHGALCISYSGCCLMSSLIGKRSGNQGLCAQCCRQKYGVSTNNKLIEDNYYLSTKDLNTVNYIKELIESGVTSLKIEGRMKRKEYVYQVTQLYRKLIDHYYQNKKMMITNNDILDLKKVYNREFTKGFIFNEDNNNYINKYRPNHMGVEVGKIININSNYIDIKLNGKLDINDGIRILSKPNDIGFIVTKFKTIKNNIIRIYKKLNVKVGDKVVKTTDFKQIKEINININETKKIPVKGYLCKDKSNIIFKIEDNLNNIVKISTKNYEMATNNGTDVKRIELQLKKTGNTIFEFKNLKIDLPEKIYIKIAELNNLRRKAIDKLILKRQYNIPYIKEKYYINIPNFPVERKKGVLINLKQKYQKYKNFDYYYVEDTSLYNFINNNVSLRLPRVIENFKNIDKPVLVNDLGSIYKYQNVCTDFSLNVVNSYSVALLHSLNVKKVCLSYELNDNQIKDIIDAYHSRYNKHPNLEIIIKSTPEVMISKFNLEKYLNIENKNNYLVDKFNNKFKFKIKDNIMTIYFYKKIIKNNTDNYYKIGINNLRINDEI